MPHTGMQNSPKHTMSSTKAPVSLEPTPSNAIARARKLVNVLDRRGLDPILGFIVPGLGDLATLGLGAYILKVAFVEKLPWVVIARMILNLALDTIIGVIPFLGDAFDFYFRANQRNLVLLEERHAKGRPTSGDWFVMLGATALLCLAITLPVFVFVRLWMWIL